MPVMALTMLLNTVVTPTPNACTATIATTAINAATMEYSTIVWPRSPASRSRRVHRVCMGLTSSPRPCPAVRLLTAEAEELRPGGIEKHHQEHREDEQRHREEHAHGALATLLQEPRPLPVAHRLGPRPHSPAQRRPPRRGTSRSKKPPAAPNGGRSSRSSADDLNSAEPLLRALASIS